MSPNVTSATVQFIAKWFVYIAYPIRIDMALKYETNGYITTCIAQIIKYDIDMEYSNNVIVKSSIHSIFKC